MPGEAHPERAVPHHPRLWCERCGQRAHGSIRVRLLPEAAHIQSVVSMVGMVSLLDRGGSLVDRGGMVATAAGLAFGWA